MPQINRVLAKWTGGSVGTGWTNFFFTASVSTPQLCADAARKFLSDCYSSGANLPSGISIQVQPLVDVVEQTNGETLNSVAITSPAVVTGSDTTRYAAVAGACVTWKTGDFVGGHRVRGRTFLVPMGGQGLQNDGTIDTTILGFINTAATAMVAAAPEFVVWRRPSGPAATDGSSHIVGAGLCGDRTAFLSSRR